MFHWKILFALAMASLLSSAALARDVSYQSCKKDETVISHFRALETLAKEKKDSQLAATLVEVRESVSLAHADLLFVTYAFSVGGAEADVEARARRLASAMKTCLGIASNS